MVGQGWDKGARRRERPSFRVARDVELATDVELARDVIRVTRELYIRVATVSVCGVCACGPKRKLPSLWLSYCVQAVGDTFTL